MLSEYGHLIDPSLMVALLLQDTSYSRDQLKDCRWEGSQTDGGLYEVCIVENKWLVGRREQVTYFFPQPLDGQGLTERL